MNQLADEQIRYLVRGLAELDRYADVILIDTGAGISNQVMEFVMASPSTCCYDAGTEFFDRFLFIIESIVS